MGARYHDHGRSLSPPQQSEANSVGASSDLRLWKPWEMATQVRSVNKKTKLSLEVSGGIWAMWHQPGRRRTLARCYTSKADKRQVPSPGVAGPVETLSPTLQSSSMEGIITRHHLAMSAHQVKTQPPKLKYRLQPQIPKLGSKLKPTN